MLWDIRKYSMVEFFIIKMDLVRLCDLLSFQLMRLLFIQLTDGVFLLIHSTEVVTGKRTMGLIRSRPIHKQQKCTILYQFQKKKKQFFIPNHQITFSCTQCVFKDSSRNAVGKPAISHTSTMLIAAP